MKRLSCQLLRQWLSAGIFIFSAIVCGTACLSAVSAADTLTVTIVGSGSVNSTPSGIACTSGICSASFSKYSGIALDATKTWKSLNGVFSGGCSGTGSCFFNIDGETAVTATFAPNYEVTVLGGSLFEFTTLAAAYAAADSGNQIAAHVYTFNEDLILDRAIGLIFNGGRGLPGDTYYLANSGYTTLQGSLEIQKGSLDVDSLIIQ